MRLNIEKIVLVTLGVVAMAVVSYGQRTTATFAGIVTDPSGAVLPGAEVQMINEGTAAATQQLTNETGEFVFNFVPAGNYTLKIGMAGLGEARAKPLASSSVHVAKRVVGMTSSPDRRT